MEHPFGAKGSCALICFAVLSFVGSVPITPSKVNRLTPDLVGSPIGSSPGLKAAPQLYISLNSLAFSSVGSDGDEIITERRIELNWHGGNSFPTDQVALYQGNPTDPESIKLQSFNVYDNVDGRVLTEHQMPRSEFSATAEDQSWDQRSCIGNYYGAYLTGDGSDVASYTCLSSEPRWMEENQDQFGSLPIRQLLIPGTHDSGAFAPYNGVASDNIVIKYVITQEETFLAQLIHGIRYFDLRIGYYEREEFPFWLNHDVAKVNRFDESMADVVSFLSRTNEVIILDFHRFPVGFDGSEADARHAELIDYVVNELGEWMLPRDVGYEVTLNDAISQGKKVIVAYNDNRFATNPLLWPGVDRQWGDTNDVDELKGFLSNAVQQSYSEWWTAAAELTPTELDVIFDLLGGLRKAAQMVNGPVTSWIRDEWVDSSVNIVASDFYLGTGVIPLAIAQNRLRGSLATLQ